jgi:hypothetical protein
MAQSCPGATIGPGWHWPTRLSWKEAHRQPLVLPEPEAILNECILAKEEELRLQVTDDLTRLPAG